MAFSCNLMMFYEILYRMIQTHSHGLKTAIYTQTIKSIMWTTNLMYPFQCF